MVGVVVAAAVLAVATGFGLLWQRNNGRLRPVRDAGADAPDREGGRAVPGDAELQVLTGLGVRPGTPATLLQFSSAFCAPCRATRRLCGEIVGMLDGVTHIEVDAESHLDAVRALGVLRTPTLFVLDAKGRVVRRASGLPTRAHLVAAVAPLLPAADLARADLPATDLPDAAPA